jgi:hypothetical protein
VSFFIPCALPAGREERRFELATYDETIYYSFDMAVLQVKKDPTLDPVLDYRLDDRLCSHSPDGCGVWILVTLPPSEKPSDSPARPSYLVTYDLGRFGLAPSPASIVNPFTGKQ